MLERLYEIFENSSGVCTDTRAIKAGSMFFALKGDRFNGNQFAEEAIEKGCICAVVDEDVSDNVKVIKVDNVLLTLQKLARYHRDQLDIPIIGLTGSNGKTTTKELIKVVLEKKFNMVATEGNLNNHIGVPLTVLSIRRRHEIAVIEMGANKPGDIKELSDIADPEFGIITNIGKAHIEGFGGLEGVKRTKSELYRHVMSRGGKIIFDKDNSILVDLLKNYEPVATYGNTTADIIGEYIISDPFIRFKWKCGSFASAETKTHLIGRYNFNNVLAAIAVGIEFKVPHEDITKAIAGYVPHNNRSEIVEGRNTLILDAYNANPTSMKAAIENFAEMQGDKVFILGDMFELGDSAKEEHQGIVNLLESLDLKTGMLIGNHFKETDTSLRTFESAESAMSYIKGLNLSNKLILIKGSRGVKLEQLKPILV